MNSNPSTLTPGPTSFEAFHLLDDLLAVTDAQNRLLFLNQAACTALHVEGAACVGQPFHEIAGFENGAFDPVALSKVPASVNGAPDLFLRSGSPLKGERTWIVRRLEDSLEEGRFLYRSPADGAGSPPCFDRLFTNSPIPVLLIRESDGEALRANEGFCRLIGRPWDQLSGRAVLELDLMTDDPKRTETLERLSREGRIAQVETTLISRLGGPRRVLLSGESVRLDGTACWMFGFIDITDQYAAAQSLEREKNRLKSILNALPDGVYIVNSDYEIQYVNPVFERDYGEPDGRLCHEYLHGRKAPCPWCRNREVFNGQSVFWDWHNSRNDRDYLLFDTPFVNDDGSISKLEIAYDVTVRKRTENDLRNAKTLFYNLFYLSPIPFALTRLQDYTLADANPAFANAIGIPRDQIVGNSSLKHNMWTDIQVREHVIQTVLQKGYLRDIEIQFNRQDGSVRDGLGYFELLDIGGERYILTQVIDITDRKKMQRELNESEERFRAISEHSHNAICIVDENGRIVWFNEEMLAVALFTPEQVLSAESFAAFIAPESLDFVLTNFLKFVAGEPYEHHYRFYFIRGDGETRLVEKNMTDYQDRHGRRNLIINMIDITDRRRDEEERHRLQEQLQHAQRMESIGRLAGGVAHDFNNLLTGIKGNLTLAIMDIMPQDPLLDTLKEIHDAAEDASRLTQQLLAFSRKQIVEPKVLNINEVVTHFQKMLTRLLGEDIEQQVRLKPDLGQVRIDPGQVQQIVVNLAVNARDAMPEGGQLLIETGHATLTAEYTARHPYVEPGPFVMLAISDTGHGMSKEVKDHLFEPFFTTKEKGKGTGLGLATVYGIVKQNRGSIEVYSEESRGTTVKVYLPRVNEEPLEVFRPAVHDMPRGTESILVVEDEDIVRNMAVKALRRQGYSVTAYANGGEALLALSQSNEPLDLLLTDVIMPGINGRVLAGRVRELRPEIKILYSSGYTENVIAHHGVLDEGIEFLPKPYSPIELAVRVRQILDKNS